MLPSQRSTAIYGIPQSNSAYITQSQSEATGASIDLRSSPAELNINQILDLDDSFYDTRTEEVYPQQTAAGNIVFHASTLGWVKKTQMILEIEAVFELDVSALAPSTGLDRILGINSIVNNSGNADIQYWNLIQPEYAFLQPMVRFQSQLGENNQIIQRQQMNYLSNLRQICSDNIQQTQNIVPYSNIGLPTSRTVRDFIISDSGTDAVISSIVANTGEIPQDVRNTWGNIVSSINMACLTNSTATPSLQPFLVRFGVPISMLNSFWNQESYLPPDTKFRFELQFNPDAIEIMRVFPPEATGVPYDQSINMTYTNNMRIVYRRHQLRQPLQLSINEGWLTTPFLYNYDTYETIEKQFDGANTTFIKDIAISQQRPTQLIFKVTSNTVNVFASSAQISGFSYPYSTIPALFSNVKIYIGGRENYFLRTMVNQNNGNPANSKSIRDGTDLLNTLTNSETYLDHGTGWRYTISKMFGGVNEGNRLVININPGDIEKTGFMATDQGAVVIRYEMEVNRIDASSPPGAAFPNTCKLVCYKKLPEQIQYDASHNITTVSWPAVVANPGYAISNTYNMN